MTPESPDIAVLEAEARHARERYQLYRAKTYGPRPTSTSRLLELQRIHEGAEAPCGAPAPRRRRSAAASRPAEGYTR